MKGHKVSFLRGHQKNALSLAYDMILPVFLLLCAEVCAGKAAVLYPISPRNKQCTSPLLTLGLVVPLLRAANPHAEVRMSPHVVSGYSPAAGTGLLDCSTLLICSWRGDSFACKPVM